MEDYVDNVGRNDVIIAGTFRSYMCADRKGRPCVVNTSYDIIINLKVIGTT